MLTEIRSSMHKIKSLFQRTSAQNENMSGEQCALQRWSLGYCSALSKKLQSRRALSSSLSPNPVRPPLQQTAAPMKPAQLPLRACVGRRVSEIFGDVFASLDFSDSPTTPFGIKAFKESSSRPLAEHKNDGPADQYVVEPISAVEETEVLNLIRQANEGLAIAPPKLCSLGTGGVYFLTTSTGANVAVFKPTDEEPRGINNPKGYQRNGQSGDNSLRDGIRSGEGAMRERAAFLLDHHSISGVPPTTMVTLSSKADAEFEKTGSLQQYIPFDYDAEECGTGLFSVEEVHKICLADLRYVNTDRNGQNLLVTRRKDGGTTLTPIDHGYCFPDALQELYFEWMYWPQAKQPFSPSLLKFIEELDPEADLELLRQHDIVFRRECNQVFLFVNYCLKWAVQNSCCTPWGIASMLSTSRDSALERSFNLANELSHGVMSEPQVYKALDHYADDILSFLAESK